MPKVRTPEADQALARAEAITHRIRVLQDELEALGRQRRPYLIEAEAGIKIDVIADRLQIHPSRVKLELARARQEDLS